MQDGKRGYNTDPKRGADTFTPFRIGDIKVKYVNSDTSGVAYNYTAGSVGVAIICGINSAQSDGFIRILVNNAQETKKTGNNASAYAFFNKGDSVSVVSNHYLNVFVAIVEVE